MEIKNQLGMKNTFVSIDQKIVENLLRNHAEIKRLHFRRWF